MSQKCSISRKWWIEHVCSVHTHTHIRRTIEQQYKQYLIKCLPKLIWWFPPSYIQSMSMLPIVGGVYALKIHARTQNTQKEISFQHYFNGNFGKRAHHCNCYYGYRISFKLTILRFWMKSALSFARFVRYCNRVKTRV